MKMPAPPPMLPSAQDPDPWPGVNFEIRSAGPVETSIPAVRATIGEVNRGISLEFRNFETQVNDSLLQPRMVALLSAFFGGLALLLAMIGLYGVTAYGVARRQAEIGIRVALGARPGSVIWLVLREVAVMMALGTALGLAASLAAGRLVASLLYGVKPHDAASAGHRGGGVSDSRRNGGVSACASRRSARSDGCAKGGISIQQLWRRLLYLFNRKQLEQDLADEMRLHRDLADQAPARPFGNETQLREASRAVWVWRSRRATVTPFSARHGGPV